MLRGNDSNQFFKIISRANYILKFFRASLAYSSEFANDNVLNETLSSGNVTKALMLQGNAFSPPTFKQACVFSIPAPTI